MKEAFLLGLMAMANNADDQDINMIKYVTPVQVVQNGETVTIPQVRYHYGVTANDTKADTAPHVTRYLNPANKAS